MGLPLYKSPSTRRREAEQAAAQQQQENVRRSRTGAPVPMLRREDVQRLSSQTPSVAGSGTQEDPFDLTDLSIGSEEGSEPMDLDNSDDAVSAVMSNYRRTQLGNSELATPAEEEELRLPNYGAPDIEWSTPEVDASSTPPRAPPRSSPPRVPARPTPRAVRSTPRAPFSAPQPRRQQHQAQAAPTPFPARAGQQRQYPVTPSLGRPYGFVQVVNHRNYGPVIEVADSQGQAIPLSRRLPALPRALPRPADATIRSPRRNRRGEFVASPDTSASDSGARGGRLGSESRRGNGN